MISEQIGMGISRLCRTNASLGDSHQMNEVNT